MAYILHLETSTKVCSVALSCDGELVACHEEASVSYSHSRLLTVFIERVMKEANLNMTMLSAVAVSMGPGSYTGLRIGVSTAKGLCYGLDIPLIAVSTLHAMAIHCKDTLCQRKDIVPPASLEAIYCPMIDARRMEVYTGLFNHHTLKPINDIEAVIIEPDSFSEILDEHKVLFFGDGAAKCAGVITRNNAIFIDDINPSAKGMIAPATAKYIEGAFEDLAYFEPFYLKDFVAGKPKVKGLFREI